MSTKPAICRLDWFSFLLFLWNVENLFIHIQTTERCQTWKRIGLSKENVKSKEILRLGWGKRKVNKFLNRLRFPVRIFLEPTRRNCKAIIFGQTKLTLKTMSLSDLKSAYFYSIIPREGIMFFWLLTFGNFRQMSGWNGFFTFCFVIIWTFSHLIFDY